MFAPLYLLAMLAPTASPSTPITVTGHAWAPFISPMGEPFRARSATDDTLADWFYGTDSNRDGTITSAEMIADADRFFDKLDLDHNGEIDPDEIANYEYEIAPDIQVMSRTKRPPGSPERRLTDAKADNREARERDRRDEDYSALGIGDTRQGAARYGLLNMPEPVAAADADFNRGVTKQEFRQAAAERFQLLDAARHGSLSLAQFEALRPIPPADGKRRVRRENADDTRLGNPLPTGP